MLSSPTCEKRPTLPQLDGVLVLNKPQGPTSSRCLSQMKRLGQKKIGHAGTLDPMAAGVLLVLLGQGTKLSNYLLGGGRKVYRGVLELGRETDTWDAMGEILESRPWDHIDEERVREGIQAWLGEQEQSVPPYSAAKHQGQPLYKLARKGKPVPEKRKRVTISSVEILSMNLPSVEFRVTCSSGTYIRSLAHSLGMRLGCGAVLTELTREYSHPFGLAQAVTPETIQETPERLPDYVHSIAEALADWPRISISEAVSQKVRNGTPIACPEDRREAVLANGGEALLMEGDRELALVRYIPDNRGGTLAVARGLWN